MMYRLYVPPRGPIIYAQASLAYDWLDRSRGVDVRTWTVRFRLREYARLEEENGPPEEILDVLEPAAASVGLNLRSCSTEATYPS
ncbi:MAG TPA: hypothetical protein VGW38_20380, partial [Chloroflexota bacterium]|nr:hypothetical protein [Chloroflexota bacterium]